MKERLFINRNDGFTLVETLAAVAVLVILLGVSAVGVLRYLDLLKITELDNAARAIYMAAENRAVLLSGGKQLTGLVKDGSNTVTAARLSAEGGGTDAYYIDNSSGKLSQLLPLGSIEPALRENCFYIVYEPVSGSVTDVFYAEEELNAGDDFQNFYDTWTSASRSQRMKASPMVGYYGGDMAEGENLEFSAPSVTVTIQNGERLTVTVTRRYPEGVKEADCEWTAKLSYNGKTVDLQTGAAQDRRTATGPVSDGYGGQRYTTTWVLDELQNRTGGGAFQFKDLVKDKAPGGKFTVTAQIESKSDAFTPVKDSDTDNSLFAGETKDVKAVIACLRHLQNLDTAFSGVKDITEAEQTEDILCRDNDTYPNYQFTPINNPALTLYDGQAKEIRNLYVSVDTNAGLFSNTGTGTSAQGKRYTFQNIRLINACVASTNGSAGALVGKAGEVSFQNCWVYWEAEPGSELRDRLVKRENNRDVFNYQITGAAAGGLVGELTGNWSITDCLAATLVHGETAAGGLVGKWGGSNSTGIKISNSYADCYVKGASAAGLIGGSDAGGSITLENCYAAGFLDCTDGKSATTAGLCLGGGTVNAENVYSVMRTLEKDNKTGYPNHPLAPNNDSSSQNVYHLGNTGKSYGEMTENQGENDFAKTMGGAFAWKTGIRNSIPYNLQEDMRLVNYSFPGLADLPHYGDWKAQFKEPSMVYYEEYNDGGYGFSGGNARYLFSALAEKTVTKDGYAIAFLTSEAEIGDTVTITCWDVRGEVHKGDYRLTEVPIRTMEDQSKNQASYYVINLPDDMVNPGSAAGEFYRYLKFELTIGDKTAGGEYFFNPHFGDTVIPYAEEGERPAGWEAAYAQELMQTGGYSTAKVRSPRHLNNLSRFPEYYGGGLRFRQELDLDYAVYTGFGPSYRQDPIGSWTQPFNGSYNGGCHGIRGVVFQVPENSSRFYAGLFGYSAGTLENVVYHMDPAQALSVSMRSGANVLYIGALAGGNSGTVKNCAVSGVNLTGKSYGSNLYMGGLVGRNDGYIQGCAAECASLAADSSSFARAWLGGLVGENTRWVTLSYAVGRVTAQVDQNSQARICGFVGYNWGSVTNSYAAVDLRSSGTAVEPYGFCGVSHGSQSETFYLNEGNFTYRESSYAASYQRKDVDKAAPTVYSKLKTTGGNSVAVSGMDRAKGSFPYPTAVKDGNGEYIHYGQWPEPMELGEMGVFYWEKLEIGGKATYHISAVTVNPNADPDREAIARRSTLSEAHNDGGVVTDYGYGYYEVDPQAGGQGQPVTFSAANIGYMRYVEWDKRKVGSTESNGELPAQYIKDPAKEADVDSVRDYASKAKEVAAQKGLKALMPDYIFHCWNSYHEGPRAASAVDDPTRQARDTAGLVLYKPNGDDAQRAKPLDPNSGVFTLEQAGGKDSKDIKVEFIVNPQFAASISVKDPGGMTCAAALKKNPGTAENPYQVRCGTQLQEINWHDTAYTDVPLDTNTKFVVSRFPYLSGADYDRNYHWKQTHDMDWTGEGNVYDGKQPGVFFTIAQARASGTSLPGWFGGSYDGGSYTMKNFNIGINTKNYDVNCMGLFGVVKGAVLKDIVMFSESGNDVVTVRGRDRTIEGENAAERDRWYAGGVLVGLAMKDDGNRGEITNCAVAGYTIKDQATRTREQQLNDKGKPAISLEFSGNGGTVKKYVDMGGAIGGLVGMTDMDLTGCVAATTIKLENTYPAQSGTIWNVPLRVGGLVGSTTGKVTNCYTGGTIDARGRTNEIYIGRITGGVGMVTADYYTRGNDETGGVSVKNCYSYMTVSKDNNNTFLYAAMNGDYGGRTTRENNYYLGNPRKDNVSGEESRTYQQLAGKDIYDQLKDFSPVTSEEKLESGGAVPVYGKYSFAPTRRGDLKGRDYPFPTILTREGFHVHYGEWPLFGIQRNRTGEDGKLVPVGGGPIKMDLFSLSVYDEETMTSTEGVPTDGKWSVESDNPGIIEPKIDEDTGKLTVTAQDAGDARLTVHYLAGGTDYTLSIEVYVTASLELRPKEVYVYPGDEVSLALEPWPENWPEDKANPLAQEGLTLLTVSSESLTCTLEPFQPKNQPPEQPARPGLKLSGFAGEREEHLLSVTYQYTYNEKTYDGNSTLRVVEQQPPKAQPNEDGTWTISFGEGVTSLVAWGQTAGYPTGQDSIQVENGVITLKPEDFTGTLTLNVELELNDSIRHHFTMDVFFPPKEEGEEPEKP